MSDNNGDRLAARRRSFLLGGTAMAVLSVIGVGAPLQ